LNGLRGKKILFIGIGFYDYEASIVARLRRHDAQVHAFYDRPALLRRSMFATSVRLARIDTAPLISRHEKDILRRIGDVRFDYVLIIKASELRTFFLETLRQRLSSAHFILYQWDSLVRMPGIEARLHYFDRILSFDRADCAAHPNILFRPLFYRDESPPLRGPAADLDLCFVGWLHSDRLSVIRRLQAQARSHGVSFFVYLFTGIRTALRLSFGGNGRNVHVRPLPYSKLLALYRRASVVLDLPHALQSGLTMRAIEAIGHGRKLLTTALDVVNYDFYSIDNVCVMRPDELELAPPFIHAPPARYPPSIVRRYSLDGWIEDVFDLAGSRAA
jgi:hypothetical protein